MDRPTSVLRTSWGRSASTLILLAFGADTYAQQATLEEVIVSARKKDESVQDIPLSITAITAADIENFGVTNLRDVVNMTPGLSMSEFGAGTLNFPVIRGMTNLTAGALAENNVSVFYNGVYLLDNNMVDVSFLDIERIEVVKGPVSALYGRNAYSGVINYVTKRPSEEFQGNVLVRAGSDGRAGIEGSVSGPLANGKMGYRIAARTDNFDGTWRDGVSDTNFGGYEKRAIQASLEFDPNDAVNILTTVYYSEDLFDQPARALTDGNCGAPAGSFQPTICGQTPDYGSDTESRIRSSDPVRFTPYGNERELLLATADASFELGSMTLRSITSYMDGESGFNRDTDGTGVGRPYGLVSGGSVNLSAFQIGGNEDEAFTQELRLSSSQDQKFRWSVGAFYSDFERLGSITLFIDDEPVPAGDTALVFFPIGVGDASNPDLVQYTDLSDEEYSGFGMIDFDATDQITLSAEARYTDQTKFQNQLSTFLTFPNDADGPDGVEGSWDFWSFRFTANYQLNTETLLYASAAKGNKAGGFNSGAMLSAELQYDPESNWTYEIGSKMELMDGRMTLNTAVFYVELSDLQLNGFTESGLGAAIRNGGEATTYGFEIELAASITEGVSVGAGVAYTNPEFEDGSTLNSSVSVNACRNIPECSDRVQTNAAGSAFLDLSGLSLPRQSNWQGTLNFDVVQPLTNDWDWTLRGNYRYETKQYSTNPQANVGFIGDRHVANLRLGVENDRYRVTAYVNNLFDDGTPFNFGNNLNPSNFTFPQFVVYGDQRTFGIEASASF